MADNSGRLLGMYDELSAFLTKIKLYGGRRLSDSHELAMFLELYNANPWTRTTGNKKLYKHKPCTQALIVSAFQCLHPTLKAW